jgi:hypothetical protein
MASKICFQSKLYVEARPLLRLPSERSWRATIKVTVAALFVLLPAISYAQTQFPNTTNSTATGEQTQQSGSTGAPTSQSDAGSQTKPATADTTQTSTKPDQQSDNSEREQTKRIFWIIPNYRAVSASTKLPPLSTKTKFWLATQDSFDYSSFVLAGLLAGYNQAVNSSPEFHQGLAGYGRYYWHSFVDEAVGNYFTEAIIPVVAHQDPRYYTLGHGGFVHRAGYAVSRLLITRTDSGGQTFNFSEISGNLMGAGVSNIYYPAQERTFGKTAEKWGTQIGVDGIANLLKEFWPDIRHGLSRR